MLFRSIRFNIVGKRRQVDPVSFFGQNRFQSRIEKRLPKTFLPLRHLDGLEVAMGINNLAIEKYIKSLMPDGKPVISPKNHECMLDGVKITIPYIVAEDLERLVAFLDIESNGHLTGHVGKKSRTWPDVENANETEEFHIQEPVTTDKAIQILRFTKEIVPYSNYRIHNLDTGFIYTNVGFVDLILDEIPPGTLMKISFQNVDGYADIFCTYHTRFLKSSFDLNVFYQSDPIHS